MFKSRAIHYSLLSLSIYVNVSGTTDIATYAYQVPSCPGSGCPCRTARCGSKAQLCLLRRTSRRLPCGCFFCSRWLTGIINVKYLFHFILLKLPQYSCSASFLGLHDFFLHFVNILDWFIWFALNSEMKIWRVHRRYSYLDCLLSATFCGCFLGGCLRSCLFGGRLLSPCSSFWWWWFVRFQGLEIWPTTSGIEVHHHGVVRLAYTFIIFVPGLALIKVESIRPIVKFAVTLFLVDFAFALSM